MFTAVADLFGAGWANDTNVERQIFTTILIAS